MTKERIEELYKSGAITFDEAIELSKGEITTPILSKELMEPLKRNREEYMDYFLDHIFDDINKDGEIIRFIDFEKIVEYMNHEDLKWRGKAVTTEMLKEEIRNQVKNVIDKLFKQIYKEGESYDSAIAYVDSGCIETFGRFNKDQDIEFDVKFIPVTGYTSFNTREYLRCLE